MSNCSHIRLLASYNSWMNTKLYAAADHLSATDLALNRHAFFGSIIGTLNHILVGDILWLKRFATHPAQHTALDSIRRLSTPTALDTLLFTDLGELSAQRQLIDQAIEQWSEALTEQDLQHLLQYGNVKGVVAKKHFGSLVLHFFNHQTHHRGQASTLLHQAGQDIGVTDLLALIPNEMGE